MGIEFALFQQRALFSRRHDTSTMTWESEKSATSGPAVCSESYLPGQQGAAGGFSGQHGEGTFVHVQHNVRTMSHLHFV